MKKSVLLACNTPAQRAKAVRELREKFAADKVDATVQHVGSFKIVVTADEEVFDANFTKVDG